LRRRFRRKGREKFSRTDVCPKTARKTRCL
jgi:hypothetical protein